MHVKMTFNKAIFFLYKHTIQYDISHAPLYLEMC